MCYTRRKIEGGVGALRESDDSNFLKPNGQSRNLNVYVIREVRYGESMMQMQNMISICNF